MKKLTTFAVLAACCAGAAFAADGIPPRAYGNSGWTPDQAFSSNPSQPGSPHPGDYSSWDSRILGGAPAWAYGSDNRHRATPYPRTTRDRDGDGVVNWRDNHPDNPRRQ